MGDKPVLVGILCPESHFPNRVSPHALLCQTCFSGLSQKVNSLARRRGGRRQNTKKIAPVKVLLKVFIPLPPGQQTSQGLTAQPWVTAVGTWPTATLSFQELMQFAISPPVSTEASGRKGAEEQGGRAQGKTVQGEHASLQPAADRPAAITAVARGLPPGGPDGARTARAVPRRSTGAPTVDSAVTVHSPVHWKKLTIFNLAFLFFPSPTFVLIPRTRVSPVTMASHTTSAHTPSVQQPWRSPQVRLNFCWPSNEEESRELK